MTSLAAVRTRRALRLVAAIRSSKAQPSEDAHALAWAALDALKTARTPSVERAVQALMRRQEASVLAAVRDAAKQQGTPIPQGLSVGMVFDVEAWIREALADLEPSIAEALADGWAAGALSASYDGALDLESTAVREALAEVVQLTSRTSETTRDQLARTIEQAIEEGADVDALATRIRTLFGEMSEGRAATIARTATTAAFEAGQVEAFRDAGIEKHRWLSERDSRVRASHTAIDGQVRKLGEAFSNGCRWPGDPSGPAGETVNCRCSLLPVLEEAKAAPARSWRGERDDRIRAAYPALREQMGQTAAIDELAERESCSASTVKRALWPTK
ncbi:MAG: minor capsid protein [Rhodothermales bacterium]|nr:minor capsid protein [Rhodothermales bacterium]